MLHRPLAILSLALLVSSLPHAADTADLDQVPSPRAPRPGVHSPAMPRSVCHEYRRIAEHLDRRYQEAPIGAGLQTNGRVLQIFRSVETGSWTMVSVDPSGQSCIVATGQHWQDQIADGMI